MIQTHVHLTKVSKVHVAQEHLEPLFPCEFLVFRLKQTDCKLESVHTLVRPGNPVPPKRNAMLIWYNFTVQISGDNQLWEKTPPFTQTSNTRLWARS